MNHKSVVLIGAGGHSRSVIALLRDNEFLVKKIFDDSWKPETHELIMQVPVSGKISDISSDYQICLAVGDNKIREILFSTHLARIYKQTIQHSTAFVDNTAVLGNSNLVFANAFINAESKIGDNNILNTGCIIEHECIIGNHNHISVSAVLCGRVKVGNNCFIGSGATIIDKLTITNHVIIGAGSVVVKDIVEPGTYVGNPARKIK